MKPKSEDNSSDEIFLKVGDKLGEQLDTCKEIIHTGEEAAKLLKFNLTTTTDSHFDMKLVTTSSPTKLVPQNQLSPNITTFREV